MFVNLPEGRLPSTPMRPNPFLPIEATPWKAVLPIEEMPWKISLPTKATRWQCLFQSKQHPGKVFLPIEATPWAAIRANIKDCTQSSLRLAQEEERRSEEE
jgi:hypothetical protein